CLPALGSALIARPFFGQLKALLGHREDADRPASRLPYRIGQLLPVGGERHRRRGIRRLVDAPGPALRGSALRQFDEAAELLLPIVEAQVTQPAVPLLPP